MSTWSSEKIKINKNIQHWIMCMRMCERAKIGDIKEQTYKEKNSKARNGPVDPPTAGISASITVICIIISRWPWLFHEENKWKQVYRIVAEYVAVFRPSALRSRAAKKKDMFLSSVRLADLQGRSSRGAYRKCSGATRLARSSRAARMFAR